MLPANDRGKMKLKQLVNQNSNNKDNIHFFKISLWCLSFIYTPSDVQIVRLRIHPLGMLIYKPCTMYVRGISKENGVEMLMRCPTLTWQRLFKV